MEPRDESRFRDRVEAGRHLAVRLEKYRGHRDVVVLGLPRGGVVTAAEVARVLSLPLDVIVSRKLGAPGNPELAIGAISETGPPYLDRESVEITGTLPGYVDREIARQRGEIARRLRSFREGRPLSLPGSSTVIVVDDGIATGSTMFAAVHALRALGVKRIVAAIPVAPPETVERLREEADEIVVLRTPVPFMAVGRFYADFRQISDAEVCELLDQAEGEGRRPGRE